MSFTQGRTGYQQDITEDDNHIVLFDSSTDGKPLRGVELSCQTEDVLVTVYGLHDTPASVSAGGDSDEDRAYERIIADAAPVQRFAFHGDHGLITKIVAILPLGGSPATITWNPCLG